MYYLSQNVMMAILFIMSLTALIVGGIALSRDHRSIIEREYESGSGSSALSATIGSSSSGGKNRQDIVYVPPKNTSAPYIIDYVTFGPDSVKRMYLEALSTHGSNITINMKDKDGNFTKNVYPFIYIDKTLQSPPSGKTGIAKKIEITGYFSSRKATSIFLYNPNRSINPSIYIPEGKTPNITYSNTEESITIAFN